MAKKSKKNAIPKKIGGFKTPKTLRRSKLLRSMLGSTFGREVLATALTAGAAAAASALVRNRDEIGGAASVGAKKSARAAGVLGTAAQDGANAIMDVVASAARGGGESKGKNRGASRSKH